MWQKSFWDEVDKNRDYEGFFMEKVYAGVNISFYLFTSRDRFEN